ncbi:hypothetical protein COU62_01270 [Candidatus Pacearchaeota archaeon CG10_big_fil_rev_8_21_14_0_10_35_219]|nr:DUF2283 domain-containing protein [Candidatus Pacearchaeota archaeon]OIO43068.1 MAG: hypothetical protein AUJ63_01440 [Candidatus Pacearchaeota archaeon CG1_02_35_32]PIO08193.1 MAG: hypothetical protein COU62_01270 [Candidatus Pacearchaeota archaeon CG10_big_fil_rev_8_21_14_0_10_35_219]PIY81125.1 MAG: hypothetical protein COY79_04980 [Candidatus Pacearchaeota archaeon CG_4_10_14_0_8_um_filter_35_169]PIZ79774.1 MAG: hypothetical protein COY00_03515 [Candidatus Pacearchaeota archaeon CG_4_10_1
MANTQAIKPRHLEGKGEMDYDYVNDILFFKVSEREYAFSVEFQNMVIDIDEENFIVGIQIFEASKFLRMSKVNLREIPRWKFNAKLDNNTIEIRLDYQLKVRNRIFEKNPIIIQENKSESLKPQVVRTI